MFNFKTFFQIQKESSLTQPITPPLATDILPFIRPVKGQPVENANWWNIPVNLTHKDARQFGHEYALLLIHYLKTGGSINSLLWCVRDMPRGGMLGELERVFFKEISSKLIR